MADGSVIMWQNPGIRGLPRRIVAVDSIPKLAGGRTTKGKVPRPTTAPAAEIPALATDTAFGGWPRGYDEGSAAGGDSFLERRVADSVAAIASSGRRLDKQTRRVGNLLDPTAAADGNDVTPAGDPEARSEAEVLFGELAHFAGLDGAAADAIAALAEAEAAVVEPSVAVDAAAMPEVRAVADSDEPSRISQALSGTLSLSSDMEGGSRPDFSTLSSIESLTLSRSST